MFDSDPTPNDFPQGEIPDAGATVPVDEVPHPITGQDYQPQAEGGAAESAGPWQSPPVAERPPAQPVASERGAAESEQAQPPPKVVKAVGRATVPTVSDRPAADIPAVREPAAQAAPEERPTQAAPTAATTEAGREAPAAARGEATAPARDSRPAAAAGQRPQDSNRRQPGKPTGYERPAPPASAADRPAPPRASARPADVPVQQETADGPPPPHPDAVLGAAVRWARTRQGPAPADFGRLNRHDQVMVRAAAGILTGQQGPLPPTSEITKSFTVGSTVASLVVAADALPQPAEPKTVKLAPKIIKGLVETVSSARSTGLTPEERGLTDAADEAIYGAYKTHASGPMGRLLLNGMAAEMVGQNLDSDTSVAMGVAARFQAAYREVSTHIRQLPEAVQKPVQILHHRILQAVQIGEEKGIPSARTYVQQALEEFSDSLDEHRNQQLEAARAEATWRGNQKVLPEVEKRQSEYHNGLVGLPPRRLAEVVNDAYPSYRQAVTRLAEADRALTQAGPNNMLSTDLKEMRDQSVAEADTYARRVAGAGMALLEQSKGARVDQEDIVRQAWKDTGDSRLGWELQKIHAARAYGRLMPRILPPAVASANARSGAIAEGFMSCADAVLCTSINPISIYTTVPEQVDIVDRMRNQLTELQGTPTRELPTRGAYINGVFKHYGYHQTTTGSRGGGANEPARPAAAAYDERTGIPAVMRAAYVADVLSMGDTVRVPHEVRLRRLAAVAEAAGQGIDVRGLSPKLQERVADGRAAQRELREYERSIDRILKPYVDAERQQQLQAERAAKAAARAARPGFRGWR